MWTNWLYKTIMMSCDIKKEKVWLKYTAKIICKLEGI